MAIQLNPPAVNPVKNTIQRDVSIFFSRYTMTNMLKLLIEIWEFGLFCFSSNKNYLFPISPYNQLKGDLCLAFTVIPEAT